MLRPRRHEHRAVCPSKCHNTCEALGAPGGIALRSVPQHEWLLILNGSLSIAFGVILMVQPGAGALAVAWMIAWYAIFFGCLYIALAFRLRQYKRA